jgi:hypothetical protein
MAEFDAGVRDGYQNARLGVSYGAGVYGAGVYVGTPTLTILAITIDGVPVPLDRVVADVTIHHGRADFFDSASASTCQLTLLGVTRAMMRPFRLGSLLVVTAIDAAGSAPRFTGRFTDGSLLGDSFTGIAVARLRTLSGYTVGTAAYPEETWSARVTRIFGEAGLAAQLVLETGTLDPILLARPIEPVALSAYLDSLATMLQAAVVDLPDGTILVQALAARSVAGAFALDPAEVQYSPTWAQRLPGGNVVTVTYGEPEASVSSSDAASVALYGPITATIGTDFKLAADANQVLQNRLGRDAYAHWTVPSAPLLVGRRLRIGKPVTLSLLPAASPYDPWTAILEGYTDTIVSDGDELAWTMELAMSDPLLSGITLSWNETPPAYKWNTINQTVAWRDALSLDSLTP